MTPGRGAQPPTMHASLQSRRHPGSRVGPERMALLQAITEQGTISAAARQVGLSYKGAWDAVQALNNLFDQPLVVSQPGGRRGGAAQVTEAGLAVLAAFARIETALADIAGQLDSALDSAGASGSLIWSFGMKTTARNALRGVIETVSPGAVNGEVCVRISPAILLVAIVTSESIAELGLVAGREVVALINASSVILAVGEGAMQTSARNALTGVVVRHETGAVNDEVVLELSPGKTLAATITRQSAEALGLQPGAQATALIKASHVILAVD